MRVLAFFLSIDILQPAFLHGGRLASGSLALNLDLLALVVFQFVRQVGLLGGDGSLGGTELLNVRIGVPGLDGLGLVGTEFAEVQVLDRVRWTELVSIDTGRHGSTSAILA